MNRYIALFILGLLPTLSGCLERPYPYKPPEAAEKRLPFRAVVWVFKDETPDVPGGLSAPQKDGPRVIWSNLTRSASPWRPRLTMDYLSSAMAAEIQARLMQTADVVAGDSYGFYPIVEEEAKGARLFVEGTVQQASWTPAGAATASTTSKWPYRRPWCGPTRRA
jgi:hypothetical protein